jgi:hypothetical protein
MESKHVKKLNLESSTHTAKIKNIKSEEMHRNYFSNNIY